MALLNYYFVNLPWLTQDPGVSLGDPEEGILEGDDTKYQTVLMTFGKGVGDTPDDYYKLYIHPTTHQLKACEYVVTYKSLLPEGVAHSPVHRLVYDEWSQVEGLSVPTRYTIYEQDKIYASCTIRNWSFSKPFDTTRMSMPNDAVLDESKP